MPDFQSIVNSLLARSAKTDPVLLSILQEIVNELRQQGIDLSELSDTVNGASNEVQNARASNPPAVVDFDYIVNDTNVVLFWTAPTSAAIFYEIREGTNWDTANFITSTANTSAVLAPLSVGAHTYLIKTRDTNGLYSTDFDTVTIIIGTINTFGIVPQVIDNNVLLRWNEPESDFKIDYYTITKNGIVIGQAYSTFFISTELEKGDYTYGVTAVDIYGNKSPESTITLSVNGPTDYVLRDHEDWQKNGTVVNGVFDDTGVLNFMFNTTETYQQHFVSNTFLSPQDQINAGYPYWMQPSTTLGSYSETFDFGVVVTNSVVSINYQYELISGAFNVGIEARVSDDGVTWSSAFTTSAFFVTSVRYVQILFTLKAPIGAMLKFGNVSVALSVKEEMDGGNITALATDVGGTFVAFNKAFYDVVSITVSAQTTQSFMAIYDFVDVPNPTGFYVYVYKNNGSRTGCVVSWKARGIM